MSDSRPSTANEKLTITGPDSKNAGWFSRRKHPKSVDIDEKGSEVAVISPEPEVSPVSFTELFRFSTKFELIIDGLALVAAVAAGSAQPLMTLLFGNLTNQFVIFQSVVNKVNEGDQQAINDLPAAAASFRHVASKDALYLVIIGIGMFICTYLYMYVWVYTAEVNAKRIRERYLRAVLRQDIPFFDKVGAGEVATRIQTDTHLVQQGMSEKVALVVSFLSAFATGFILAYIRSWRLALALTSLLPCIGITGAVMNKAISKYMQLSLKHIADAGNIAEEVISTVRTAQAFGTQRILSSLYDQHVDKSKVVDVNLSVVFFCIYSSYALAFSFGTTLILRRDANDGTVINVFMAILIGSFSLALLAPEMQAITHGRGAAAKLYATIDRVPDIDSADLSGEKPETVYGEVTLEDIHFNYPSRPDIPVVKGINLTFRAGKTAALVGASGSGKSTVISLIERFYDPLSGVVKLDGRELKSLNVRWLRSQIGLVSQEPTLFATTIRGNVEHGLIGTKYENASEEEKFALIKEACVKSNADGFITKLPLGYDTMVGERGFLLSGGQKQRVAIARAIVSDPRILLLDEATSALDTQSEGIVQDALDKASAGRTTITIAHRLSTIKDADVIFVMGDGLVIEQGTHQQLLAKEGGAYARLVQAQKLRESDEAAAVAAGEDTDEEEDAPKDMEKVAREEVPLGRRNTGQSLASQILEQKKKEREGDKEPAHSMYYLFKRMGKINKSQWRKYFLGTIFATMTGMVYPAFGVVYAKAINGFSFTGSELRHSGDRNALWFFIIAIISTLSIGMQNYLFSSSAAALMAKLRSLSFKAILRQDIEYFDNDEHSTGSLVANLSDNPQKVFGLAGATLAAIVQSISTLIVGSILGLIFIWKVGLVGIAVTPLLVSMGYIRLRVVVLKDQKNKKAHESSAQLACEAAGAIRTVASLTREDDCCNQYALSLEEPLRKSNRTAIWSNMLYAFSQSTIFFCIALVFWFGADLVSRREFSTFDFFVGLMSTMFGAIQAGNVFSFVPDVSSARGAGSDIIRLLDSIPEIDAQSTEGKKIDVAKAQGHIRLENVHFRYPTRPGIRVLRELSLQVEPGTYIALVGASGSGKSTVIQLIERFYQPLAGQIYMDGIPIEEYNIQEYRKQIALVSQEPTLYAGTIRFNILLGAIKPQDQVTQEEIEAACRDANILDFINGLPDGFDTEVGGKGSQLSGGQKQRIAIARALLRNPKVLLLDEATSALDSNSEKVVQAALDQAAKGRTTVAIAHRLSTIQNADCIYFIKEGRVSESGTHDQLISRKGDYYEYVQLQALSKRD
ncbi:P-loop containing nucleoside triphosphate hydrolase protein [Guyanagaster necrorhizus]|uniref:P-loop containing nucleoside triphosphate hydrolase protein n=1 Tax=Guyanagaster necrorhizus TaxID=856835 RepID=A0A9P7VHX9_9AGAR|nr:P-loop containing nucleoside triphosphate hydrolase protein [Guyanagaster necrorhizus MCA 3950]KAG7440875.1 P-loop containing nucleoside triphosphate hydrolase protein [Guyanagaster necrorhizus MCA 3950]